MTHTPCVVIPNFNHGYALPRIIETIRRYNLPIIVVNDGSTDSTGEVLDQLAKQHTEITPLHRAVNGGKGAALRDGFRVALEQGYSHAICVDGDGQHDVSDIPHFIEASRHNPDALIFGRPIFGTDAPLIRRLGRELSNLAVVASTWSFSARDVLCGFRVYPLTTLASRVDLSMLELRMGFDVEIAVRAMWEGIRVVNIPTHVVYPQGGVSHFRYVEDNKTLIRLELRLIVAGLWRGPRRIVRSLCGFDRSGNTETWYRAQERGGSRGLRIMLRIFELLGRWPLLCVMAPVVAYMFLFGGASRRSALDFQRRVARENGAGDAGSVSSLKIGLRALQQFWEFAVALVDKVVSWRNGLPLERFTWSGRDEVKSLLAAKQGVIMIGAHVGNLEVVRALGESRQVIVHALMYTGNSRHFRAILEEVNASSFLRVHDLATFDSGLVFTLHEALARGEVVALLGDRVPKLSEGRGISLNFLGQEAVFPEGPWILASILGTPVFTVFTMRGRDGKYHVEFSKLCDRVELTRGERREAITHYAAKYSTALASVVRRYPTQWFNFYDFWRS